jgi:hypothetical protein
METIVVVVVVCGGDLAYQRRPFSGVKRMVEIRSDGDRFPRAENHGTSGRESFDHSVTRNADWRLSETFIGPGVVHLDHEQAPANIGAPVDDVFCLDEMTMKGGYLVLANE